MLILSVQYEEKKSWCGALFSNNYEGGCATADLSLESGSYVFPDHVSRPDTVGIGVVIRACCNQGYVREGPENIICLSTGEFTSEKPSCIGKMTIKVIHYNFVKFTQNQ